MWNFIPGVKKPEPKPPPKPKGRPKSTAQPAFEIPQMREGRLGTRKELELEERLRVLEARLNTATQNSERSLEDARRAVRRERLLEQQRQAAQEVEKLEQRLKEQAGVQNADVRETEEILQELQAHKENKPETLTTIISRLHVVKCLMYFCILVLSYFE